MAHSCGGSGEKCMCNACDCGVHKCPAIHANSAVHYPADLGSEYTHVYQKWPKQERARPKPHAANKDSPPFVGLTTHMIDYAPKRLPERAKDARPHDNSLEHCMPHGNYNGAASEYRERYKNLPIQARVPPSRKPVTNNNAKFDGTTTNHTDYQKWPVQKRTPVSRAGDSNFLSDGKPHSLDDRTTYHADFWDKSKSVPKPERPRREAPSGSKAKFYGETTNHADYGPKPLPAKGERPSGAHLRDALSGTGHEKFDDETTYHKSFQAWPVKPTRRADVHKAKTNDVKFSGETMYHSDFKAPKLPKRCPVLCMGRPDRIEQQHFVYDDSKGKGPSTSGYTSS